jgi:hypothetical protein
MEARTEEPVRPKKTQEIRRAMSTTKTLKYHRDENTGQAFRIYAELFGEKDVYLELEGVRFEAGQFR